MAARHTGYLAKYQDAPTKDHKKSKKHKKAARSGNVLLVDNDVAAPSRALGGGGDDPRFASEPVDGTGGSGGGARPVLTRARRAEEAAPHVVDFDHLPEDQAAVYAMELARGQSSGSWVQERR